MSEVPRHTIEDHGHWIEVRLIDGSDVTDADLLAFRDDLTALPGWREKPVLIHMGALRGVSLEGRQRLIRYRHPTLVAVLGSGPMDRVLANFIIRSTRAQYFSTRADALHWLSIDNPDKNALPAP
ncbi:hypothetical protein V6S67_18045 [Arthrobacter sp. Soc17.1.1.1]|uniref:hypothetical protein n=1 Tax=Arthrobacter sp. Soc17.1.1.1 TaxID=3121277 RepID=UPI002FE45010